VTHGRARTATSGGSAFTAGARLTASSAHSARRNERPERTTKPGVGEVIETFVREAVSAGLHSAHSGSPLWPRHVHRTTAGGVRSCTRMTAVPSAKVNRSWPPGSGDPAVSVVHQPLRPSTEDTAAKTESIGASMVRSAW
jgi:hypothetical protein